MPNISAKGKRMPESPIRKLVPFAEEAKKRGTQVIHLNIGQPDIKTPELALKAIKEYPEKVVAYSHSAGYESYRKALANYYNNCGLPISHEEIMVTTGGSEAITMTLNSIMDEGDEVIIPEPFYANYNGFSVSAGVNVVPVVSTIENNFALPSIEEFEKKITAKTKAIIICNPGNPTGYLYSKEELELLAEIVKKHDLFLIADEVYREFAYDGKTHHSILSLGIEDYAIVIDSTSKRYSMCGARVGCLITQNKEVFATCMKFAQARLSPPSFGQVAGEAALQTDQSYFDEVISEYLSRRDLLVEGLNNITGVKCAKPTGAFYCIAELPVEDAEDFAQWLLEEFSHKGHTVMVAPAQGFYSTPEIGKKQVRIAYVLNKESLELATEILDEALKVYNK
ncbi:MAG: pyridoxal phosphate-dependent aminotransferase [Flavobacteriales bacterium]|jgi:aspartate aminotransferase|nr:pyridoxal phosphate-dependent aminotransferase [Flavobacteriales bacterium]